MSLKFAAGDDVNANNVKLAEDGEVRASHIPQPRTI